MHKELMHLGVTSVGPIGSGRLDRREQVPISTKNPSPGRTFSLKQSGVQLIRPCVQLDWDGEGACLTYWRNV